MGKLAHLSDRERRWRGENDAYHRRRIERLADELDSLRGDVRLAIDELTNDGGYDLAVADLRLVIFRVGVGVEHVRSALSRIAP